MKKRWLLRLGLLAGLALFGFWFALWWTAPEHRINKESCDQIRNGMTETEVVAIIGASAGDYTTAETEKERDLVRWILTDRVWQAALHGNDIRSREWLSDNGAIQVLLDQNGTVISKEFFSIQATFIAKLRRWLRLS